MRRTQLVVALSFALLAPASAQAAVVNVAPSGSDMATCAREAPCRSLARAYTVAAGGDVVSVAGGIYPRQDVPAGTKSVTFRGEPGVVVRQMFVHAANVTLDSINVDAGAAKTVGGAALETTAPNITFKNAYVGNVTDEKGVLSGAGCTGCVFDNVHFRDVRIATDGVHNECLYSQSPNITIRNSRFTNCATMDIFFTRGSWWGQPYYGGFELTNNFFGKTYKLGGAVHHYSVVWGDVGGGTIRGAVIRGNTFELPVAAAGTFADSVESCNAPQLNEAGITHETCVPVRDPSPAPAPAPAPALAPAPAPPPTPARAPASRGRIVGAWNFNEMTGTRTRDKSGLRNHGTIFGATRVARGKFGRAVSFDGINDYISISDSSSLDLGRGMTIEAWVYAKSVRASRLILMKEHRAAGHQSYSLYAAANGLKKASVEVATGPTYTTLPASSTTAIRRWTHIAATYDGSRLRIYKNGVSVGSRALSGDLVATGDPLKIGGSAVWSEFFKGKIDEVRVWNAARTGKQIQSDMKRRI